nr:MAG: protein of unknown function DUF3862 [Bacteriophage sp.]
MKKIIAFVAGAIIVTATIIGCMWAVQHNINSMFDEINNRYPNTLDSSETNSQSTVVVSKSPELDALKQSVKEFLNNNYAEFEVSNVWVQGQILEVTIVFKDASAESQPENWEETKTSIIEISNSLYSEFSNEALTNVVVYADDANENHLISTKNGKVSYDAFEDYSASGANPPTISLAEFNAIFTGMTYQEVIDIIGSTGEILSEVDLGLGEEYFTQSREWDGEGSIGANAIIQFQDGKVVTKAQYGLE